MPAEDPKDESRTPPVRRLFEREWLEIVSLAKNGTSIPKIAEIYDVHHSAIYRGLRKRGVKMGSIAAEAAEQAEDETREEMIRRIKDTKDKDYRYTEFLQQQIIKTVADAQRQKASLASVLDDIKALKIAIDGVRNATDNKWRILGLDKENLDADAALPELPIREMTSHEVDAIRNRQALEDGDLSPEDLAAALDITEGLIQTRTEGEGEDDEIADETAF